MDFRKDFAFIRLRQPTSQTCTIAARTNWIFYEELAPHNFFLLHQTVAFTKDLMLAGGEGGSIPGIILSCPNTLIIRIVRASQLNSRIL